MEPSEDQEIYYPEESLAEKFENGGMEKIYNHLVGYIERNLSAFKNKCVDSSNFPENCMELIESEISRKGSVHLPSEMADQIKEINKEIWYRGEDGVGDRQEIKDEWTQRYSRKWRKARRIEILYVLKRRRNEILELIEKG